MIKKIKKQLNMLEKLQESSDFYGWRRLILEKVMDMNNGKLNHDKWINDAKSLIPDYVLLTNLLRGSMSCKNIISVLLGDHPILHPPILNDKKYPVYPDHLKRRFPRLFTRSAITGKYICNDDYREYVQAICSDNQYNYEIYEGYLEKLRFIAGNASEKFLEQLIEEDLKRFNDYILNMIQWLQNQQQKDQVPEEFLITDFVVHHQLGLAFGRYLGNDYFHDGCYKLWLNNSIKLQSLNDEDNNILKGNACLFTGAEESLCVIEFFWSVITKNQWDNLPNENKSLKGNFRYYHGKFKDDRFNTIPLMII